MFAITFIVALILGCVNQVTAPLIAENSEKARIEAIEKVLGQVGSKIADLPVSGNTSVTEIAEYDSPMGRVYAVSAAPNGYGGEIKMMIGLNSMMEVLGVSIIEMSETPGLGAKASDEAFLNQFKGYYPEVNAISGATITSNAVKKGVSDAIQEVGGRIE